MLRNYLLTAYRSLKNRTAVTGINVVGLAIGLAACLLISLWVRQELSYDTFHPESENIYRIALHAEMEDETMEAPITPGPLAPALKRDLPEVEATTRLDDQPETIVTLGDRQFVEDRSYEADSSFFDVFGGFELLRGTPETVLSAPDALVLTESTAQRYFGRTDVLGRTLDVDGTSRRVTGIVADVPEASHMHFDLLEPLQLTPQEEQTWLGNNMYTYVRLRDTHSPAAFEAKVDQITREYVGPQAAEVLGVPLREALQEVGMQYFPQRLTDIHLHSNLQYELEPNGSMAYVWTFSAIAFFILLIAGINFVNLATARATERAREVGMRKALGAQRKQLAGQFLGEAVLTTVAALAVAVGLAMLALPLFDQLAGTTLPFWETLLGPAGVGVVAAAILVGLLAGGYPALVLSGFAPATVLKSAGRRRSSASGGWLRQGLVVVQFVVSIALIAATLAVWNQFDYIQTKRLGLDTEQVVALDRGDQLGTQQAAFKRELRQLSGVQAVGASGTMFSPGSRGVSNFNLVPDDQPASQGRVTSAFDVDPGFADVMNIEMVAGRMFGAARATDTSAVVINRAAAEAFGWDDPTQHTLRTTGPQGQAYSVIGVTETFHYQSLRRQVRPLALFLDDAPSQILVRMSPEKPSKTLASIREAWGQFAPGTPVSYTFADTRFEQLHDRTQKTGQLFILFAGLAIAIACFGLFGLATYIAQQRTKEIGIRKALGATVSQIVRLLSGDFLRLVGIAFVIAAPLAYVGMQRWLSDFAYRADLGIGVFAAAGALVVTIAFVTVGSQAVRAATLDPTTALKDE